MTLQRSGFLPRYTPLAPGAALARTTPLRSARTPETSAARKGNSAGSGRPKPFPPAVAALLDARDPWCVHCGSPGGLQRHHRRLKGIGGDGRDHTQCACNGVRLCWLCHSWAHRDARGEAETEGLIIPRSTLEPWTLKVLVHLEEDSGGLDLWPLCDGTWGYAEPSLAGAS